MSFSFCLCCHHVAIVCKSKMKSSFHLLLVQPFWSSVVHHICWKKWLLQLTRPQDEYLLLQQMKCLFVFFFFSFFLLTSFHFLHSGSFVLCRHSNRTSTSATLPVLRMHVRIHFFSTWVLRFHLKCSQFFFVCVKVFNFVFYSQSI